MYDWGDNHKELKNIVLLLAFNFLVMIYFNILGIQIKYLKNIFIYIVSIIYRAYFVKNMCLSHRKMYLAKKTNEAI